MMGKMTYSMGLRHRICKFCANRTCYHDAGENPRRYHLAVYHLLFE